MSAIQCCQLYLEKLKICESEITIWPKLSFTIGTLIFIIFSYESWQHWTPSKATKVPTFDSKHSGFLEIEFLLYFADFCDVTHLKQGSNLTFQGMPGDAQNLVLILPDTFLSNFALLFGSVQARLFEKLKAKGQKVG